MVCIFGLLIGGCRPSLESNEAKERIAALQRVDDPEKLQWHAQFDRSWNVQVAAIKRITDEEFLTDFALDPKYKYDELRLAAIEGINDPRLLARIILESRWPAVRNAAFERLTDDEQLAVVASTLAAKLEKPEADDALDDLFSRTLTKIRNPQTLEKLVATSPTDRLCGFVLNATSDQSLLKQIALKTTNPVFRYRAVARIQEPAFLEDLAADNSDWGLRLLALDRISNQPLLARFATDDRLWIIRRTSLLRLNEPDLLLAVALRSKDYDLACEATARLTQEQIDKVAADAVQWGARKSATARLEDEDALAAIAQTDHHWAVRSEAVDRIRDPALLESIALNSAHSPDRLRALARITDPDRIRQILQSSAHDDIRLAAISMLGDQEVLTAIALEADRPPISIAAVDRIDDPARLSTIADDATDLRVRTRARILLVAHLPPDSEQRVLWAQETEEPDLARAAIQRLNNQEVLIDIARSDGPDEIRDLAISRITERDALLTMAYSQGPTHHENDKPVYARSETAGIRLVELTPPDQMDRLISRSASSALIEAAIDKIDDQSVIENLALNDYIPIAWTAVKHLNDAAALQRIALNPGTRAMGTDAWARLRLAKIAKPAEAIEFLLRLDDSGARGRFADEIEVIDVLAAIVQHPDLDDTRQRARWHLLNLLARRIGSTEELEFATAVASETGPAAILPTDDEANRERCRSIQFEAMKRMLALEPKRVLEMDQETLMRIVSEQTQAEARAVAVKYLSDFATVERTARYDISEDVQAAALSRIHEQTFLEERVDWARSDKVRLAATMNLRSPLPLLRLATSDPSPAVREVARDLVLQPTQRALGLAANPIIKKAGDDEPEILPAAASLPRSLYLRLYAAFASPDDGLLQGMARIEPYAYARRRVVRLIDDERFLFALTQQDPSTIVGLAAIGAINDPLLLTAGATDSDRAEVRGAFETRLRGAANGDELAAFELQIESARIAVAEEIGRIENDLSPEWHLDELVNLALESPLDVIRLAAVNRIPDDRSLARVVLHSHDHEVLRIGLQSIDDQGLLQQIADKAEEQSARHAAAILTGKTTWEELFAQAAWFWAPPGALPAVIAAERLLPPQSGTSALLRDALRTLINRADEATVAMLEEIIDTRGTVAIAEDFYNCGHPDLKRSASLWADNHGYRFQYTIGNPEVRW